MEYTLENITKLKKNEVFVFGSNESGIHGAGAARYAAIKFGARKGQGFGLMLPNDIGDGMSFAIPTKDWNINILGLNDIQFYVDRFGDFAYLNNDLKFYVTKIGCGLAGLTVEQIAPLFRGLLNEDNIVFPKEFWDVCEKNKSSDTIS